LDPADDARMDVVVAVGIFIIIGVTWKRANTGARIGAILISLVLLWLVIAIVNPGSAALMAGGVASGFRQLMTGIGHFIGIL
jgi:hypothetical protein